jgi:hypothetical protein
MTTTRKSQQRKQIDALLGNLLEYICSLSAEKLQTLEREIAALSHMNCWWFTYQARFLLQTAISEASEQLKAKEAKANLPDAAREEM